MSSIDDELYFDTQDTFELLRCLEEVTGAATTTGKDAAGLLTLLGRLASFSAKGSVKDEQMTALALRQLQVVRAALGRNLARCFV